MTVLALAAALAAGYLVLTLALTYIVQQVPRRPVADRPDWMTLFYRFRLAPLSPQRLAPHLPMPVMLIHGADDRRFPLAFARRLFARLPAGRAALFVAPGAGHSQASQDPGYPAAVRRFLDAHHGLWAEAAGPGA